jgi:hypothetical protein
MNRDKASSPDRFTMAFFQACWDVIKKDVMRVFQESFCCFSCWDGSFSEGYLLPDFG